MGYLTARTLKDLTAVCHQPRVRRGAQEFCNRYAIFCLSGSLREGLTFTVYSRASLSFYRYICVLKKNPYPPATVLTCNRPNLQSIPSLFDQEQVWILDY